MEVNVGKESLSKVNYPRKLKRKSLSQWNLSKYQNDFSNNDNALTYTCFIWLSRLPYGENGANVIIIPIT